MYEVLASLIVNIDELKEKDPSLLELRILYKTMLSRQLRDWKART